MKKKKLALRLAQILVVLVGISFVTFLLTYLSPGDPVRNMYTAAGIMPTEELVATEIQTLFRAVALMRCHGLSKMASSSMLCL